MTYKELSKSGTKLAEYDSYDGGIYFATTELWLCDDSIYEHIERNNSLSYHGRVKETTWLGHRKKFFGGWFSPWFKQELTPEGKQVLKEDELSLFDEEWMC